MTEITDLTKRLINASICAYQIREGSADPSGEGKISHTLYTDDGKVAYDVMPSFQDPVKFALPDGQVGPAFTAMGDDDIDGALVGLTEDGYAIVAFRGTVPPSLTHNDFLTWITDWANDGDVIRKPWRPCGNDWGYVEAGFAGATEKLWGWIKETLEPLLKHATQGVLVTGHSKGAAMTFLGASLIATEWPEFESGIAVHAFAAPVAGDATFATAYATAGLDATTYRYQVAYDVVPFVPLWRDADIWTSVKLPRKFDEDAWWALGETVKLASGGGYCSVGETVFCNSSRTWVSGPDQPQVALATVSQAIETGELKTVMSAHSATGSYLPRLLNSE